MAHREEPYDPYIPSGGAGGSAPGNQRTEALQREIDTTIGIMQQNIHKVSERGENLRDLEGKTQELSHTSQGFRRGANRLRKQMWWKDMRARICLGVIIGVIVIVIIVVPIVSSK